ncbi:hypothetical protein P9257_05305 [Bacillus velezensis]|uniref:hypothetical protein n=1 Tax=Bacillus velezensis TaxID=492670 RepID=UPI002E1B242F|nr:hypothetical protein [Bacillus velezensis]
MSDKKQCTRRMCVVDEYIGCDVSSELRNEKGRMALVIGRTVNEAKTKWKRVKANYPNYKYTQFVSRNPCGIDGINAENATLFMLPGYAENPIVKDPHFQWLIKLAAEVIYVEEEADE